MKDEAAKAEAMMGDAVAATVRDAAERCVFLQAGENWKFGEEEEG